MTLPNQSKTPTRVAILIENGVEDAEFQIPFSALQEAGAEVVVLGARMNEEYKGKQGKVSVKPHGTTTEARPENFDAVIIPGGLAPDTMRNNPNTVQFVKQAIESGKLVAAVCHGPQVLIEGDLLKGKNATGFISIQKDMINAGANYLDEPLVIDGNLITSRRPGDLPLFATAIISRLGLKLDNRVLPNPDDPNAEWWQLAEAWGGNSKSDIIKALNQALTGERYTQEAFAKYAEKIGDTEIKSLFNQISQTKQQHINKLEARLKALGENPSLPASFADKFAKLTGILSSGDDIQILRHALGDIQTGVVDSYNLSKQFTDPNSTALFREIESNLAQIEQQIAKLYQARLGEQKVPPAKPTTVGVG